VVIPIDIRPFRKALTELLMYRERNGAYELYMSGEADLSTPLWLAFELAGIARIAGMDGVLHALDGLEMAGLLA